jgi:hypothetical protein
MLIIFSGGIIIVPLILDILPLVYFFQYIMILSGLGLGISKTYLAVYKIPKAKAELFFDE